MSDQEPPEETGLRIATLHRGRDEELRINWSEYEGSPYLSLRIWSRDYRGRFWPDRRRGCSIRIRELGQVAEAIGTARAYAASIGVGCDATAPRPAAGGPARRRSAAPRRTRRAGPGHPRGDAGASEPFSEF
jgi:hypothetical protein